VRRWSPSFVPGGEALVLTEVHQAVLSRARAGATSSWRAAQGRYLPWDYQPLRDASRLYIRNDQELNDLEAMARFPPLG
jgi:choline-sulfatase